jgi:hypothetical protein
LKIVDLIRSFDARTLTRFKKYLQSPLLCSDELMLKVLIVLTDEPSIKTKIPDKKNLFRALFPGQPFNDNRMRLLLSRLFSFAEDFLRIENGDKQSTKSGLLKYYRQKSLDKHFIQTYEEFVQDQNKILPKNEGYYEHSYNLRLEKYDYLVTKKRQGEFNLKEISDSIEVSYIIKKLRHCCRVLHVHSVYKLESPFPFIEEINNYVKEQKLYEIPVLGFYYYNYLAILNPTEDFYFKKCVELYQNYDHHFENEERREVYVNILNYCIRKVNEGKEQFNETVFDLYMRGLEKEFLLDQGKLSRFTYRNIAEIGINLKEYDWVNEFLETYQIKLEKQYREPFYLLEKARVLSDQKKYNQAIAYLTQLSFNDQLIELSTRLERIRIFYEMGESELSQYHVESMELFLRRKKNLGYHSDHYKSFLKYMRKLLKTNPNEKKKFRQYVLDIQSEEKITGRKWLVEKFHSMAQ